MKLSPKPAWFAWIFLSLFLISCTSSATKQSVSSTSSYSNSSRAGGQYHTVQKGETLWRISKLYAVPVAMIQQANQLATNTIKAGKKLWIPSISHSGGRMTTKYIKPSLMRKGDFSWPTEGSIVVRFGQTHESVLAKGIDIVTKSNAPILASKEGKVSFVSDSVKGYGKMIVIDHRNDYQTVYAYNAQNLVNEGQAVRRGQRIATAGIPSGTRQPTLHFEIRRNHQALNPEMFIR